MTFAEFKACLRKRKAPSAFVSFVNSQSSVKKCIENCTEITWLEWLIERSSRTTRIEYDTKTAPIYNLWTANTVQYQNKRDAKCTAIRAKYTARTNPDWVKCDEEILKIWNECDVECGRAWKRNRYDFLVILIAKEIALNRYHST
jgi:hypothetical protein